MPWKPPQRAGATVFVSANYSLAERDRRWSAVRERAAKMGLDCIFVPLGNGIDARYLTQLRCSSIVLPTDGRPPIVIADRSSRNEWVPEPWQTSREWADPMVEALIDARMERARIGVVGLKRGKVTHVRATDGVVNHSAYVEVLRRLPNATFEDATDVVGFVRYIKSAEEIECLRRAVAIAEAGIDEMVKVARPGVDGAVLYASIMERMLALGSEYHPLLLSIGRVNGAKPSRYTNPPIGLRLEPETLIQAEVNGVWGAQVAEEEQPILLGRIPDAWKPLIEFQKEVFQAGLKFMKPGTACADMIDFINGFGHRDGIKARILMLGRGMGNDGPTLFPGTRNEEAGDLRIEKGTAWTWKPVVTSGDERIRFSWGGDLAVTENGGEALFERPHGMISIV